MTRRIRCIFVLVSAVCAVLWQEVWLARGMRRGNKHDEASWKVTKLTSAMPINSSATKVWKVDKSFQFEFRGDMRISPGSLKKMTLKMQESEIEIATALGRQIKFPTR